MPERILILGAAGRIGKAAAEGFRDAGWGVTSLVRRDTGWRAAQGTDVREIDAQDEDSVIAAAQSCAVVLNALNAPFKHWPQRVPQLAEVSITAAAGAGAVLMFPGSLFNFGPDLPPVITEQTPMHPAGRKGALRCTLEHRLHETAAAGHRVIILRMGDVYGGAGHGGWFDRIVTRDLARARAIYPGPPDAVHEWAYLPDVVATMVRLADNRHTLPADASFGFPGHAVNGRELIRTIQQITKRKLSVGGMPWRLLKLLAPIIPTFRELSELAHLWQLPHRISGEALRDAIGEVPHTPFNVAMESALRAHGFVR